MKTPTRSCSLAIVLVISLVGTALGQAEGGCGLGIQTTQVKCNSTSGVKTISSSTCVVGNGNPTYYCSQNSAYCTQTNGTQVTYFLANVVQNSNCTGCSNDPVFVCSVGSPQCLSDNIWQCPYGGTECSIPPDIFCNDGESPECGEEGWYCGGGSPIIVDTSGEGFHLTSAGAGVVFDIAGNGRPVQIAWTSKGSWNAFLALDRNQNGKIDDGRELFGNFTEQPESSDPNGFLALAEFDKPENGGNSDGIIDHRDRVFSHLVLWIDENHDGISQPNELHSLPELGVYSLALRYRESRLTDQFGNQFRYKAAVNPDSGDGESKDGRITYDVFFVEGRAAKSGRRDVLSPNSAAREFSGPAGRYWNGEPYDGLEFILPGRR